MKYFTVVTILLAPGLFLAPSPGAAAGQPASVCISCHSVLSAKLSDPVKLWQASIHAGRGIGCNACHGGDTMDSAQAMSVARGYRGIPAPTAVATLCGGCHSEIAGYYMKSEHGKAAGRNGPTCVTCHGSHAIKNASVDLLSRANCSKCHTFEKARLIQSAMSKRDNMLMAIERNISRLKSQGVATEQMEMRLSALRSRLHAVFHSFDIELILKESAQIQAELERTGGAGGTGTKMLSWPVAAGAALLAVFLIYVIRNKQG